MQPIYTNRQSEAPQPEPKAAFKVAIVYEDRPTGRRAMTAFRCLADHLEAEFEVSNNLWSFDLLRVPKIREVAARDTAQADMIIVSAHGDRDLPGDIKAWVRRWVQRKRGESGALVALLDTDPETVTDTSPALTYLQEIARNAGMDFFSHAAGDSQPQNDSRFEFPESRVRREHHRSVRPRDSGPTWL